MLNMNVAAPFIVLIGILCLYTTSLLGFKQAVVINDISTGRLQMSGDHRASANKLSKRRIFRNIREVVNTAAKAPGFFEIGNGSPELSLFL